MPEYDSKKRSIEEQTLRDLQAENYDNWYLERGIIPVSVEDELIIESLQLDTAKNIIDIGCGTGRLLKKISDRFPHLEIYGLDLSNDSLNEAKLKIPKGKFIKFDLANDDINTLELGVFDRVLSVQVIQHLSKPSHSNALNKIKVLIDPENGLFVAELYNHRGLNRIFEQIRNRNLKKEIHRDNFYEYRFEAKEFSCLVEDSVNLDNIKLMGCQVFPRRVLNKFPSLESFDIFLSKCPISKYLGYYFISVFKMH